MREKVCRKGAKYLPLFLNLFKILDKTAFFAPPLPPLTAVSYQGNVSGASPPPAVEEAYLYGILLYYFVIFDICKIS